jgi:hypothetical protein
MYQRHGSQAGFEASEQRSDIVAHPDQHVIPLDLDLMHRQIHRGGPRENLACTDIEADAMPWESRG